jgi:hypothetical protein
VPPILLVVSISQQRLAQLRQPLLSRHRLVRDVFSFFHPK